MTPCLSSFPTRPSGRAGCSWLGNRIWPRNTHVLLLTAKCQQGARGGRGNGQEAAFQKIIMLMNGSSSPRHHSSAKARLPRSAWLGQLRRLGVPPPQIGQARRRTSQSSPALCWLQQEEWDAGFSTARDAGPPQPSSPYCFG